MKTAMAMALILSATDSDGDCNCAPLCPCERPCICLSGDKKCCPACNCLTVKPKPAPPAPAAPTRHWIETRPGSGVFIEVQADRSRDWRPASAPTYAPPQWTAPQMFRGAANCGPGG